MLIIFKQIVPVSDVDGFLQANPIGRTVIQTMDGLSNPFQIVSQAIDHNDTPPGTATVTIQYAYPVPHFARALSG